MKITYNEVTLSIGVVLGSDLIFSDYKALSVRKPENLRSDPKGYRPPLTPRTPIL